MRCRMPEAILRAAGGVEGIWPHRLRRARAGTVQHGDGSVNQVGKLGIRDVDEKEENKDEMNEIGRIGKPGHVGQPQELTEEPG